MTPDEWAESMVKSLNQKSKEVAEASKVGITKTAREANKVIKNHITFKTRTGKYVKSFGITRVYEGPLDLRLAWSAKRNKQYCLTHLLEFGHALRHGGRAKAYTHVQYGKDYVEQNLEKNVQKEVNKII